MIEYSLYFSILFFVFGLIFGSFFNVLIYRIPVNKSLFKPSSHCINCGNSLKWYMNIPVFSYIFLKGKCYYCGAKISLIYPSVELITGGIFLSGYLLHGL